MYSKTITWVVKDKWIGLKREFYDEQFQLRSLEGAGYLIDGSFREVAVAGDVDLAHAVMADELAAVAEREGDPDLIDRIADERSASNVDELLAWLEEHNHPALVMDPIF